jgi:hypothetical protein
MLSFAPDVCAHLEFVGGEKTFSQGSVFLVANLFHSVLFVLVPGCPTRCPELLTRLGISLVHERVKFNGGRVFSILFLVFAAKFSVSS